MGAVMVAFKPFKKHQKWVVHNELTLKIHQSLSMQNSARNVNLKKYEIKYINKLKGIDAC